MLINSLVAGLLLDIPGREKLKFVWVYCAWKGTGIGEPGRTGKGREKIFNETAGTEVYLRVDTET